MNDRLAVDIGGVRLANPVICGSGEHTITAGGVHAALASGAGAVILKSVNESDAARNQLAHTDYALFDESWNRLDWNGELPAGASLLNRSGLQPAPFDQWLEQAKTLVAAQGTAVVVPSLIPADPVRAVDLAAEMVEHTGCRAFELNTGAPHGREAAPGAINLETKAAGVEAQVARCPPGNRCSPVGEAHRAKRGRR